MSLSEYLHVTIVYKNSLFILFYNGSWESLYGKENANDIRI